MEPDMNAAEEIPVQSSGLGQGKSSFKGIMLRAALESLQRDGESDLTQLGSDFFSQAAIAPTKRGRFEDTLSPLTVAREEKEESDDIQALLDEIDQSEKHPPSAPSIVTSTCGAPQLNTPNPVTISAAIKSAVHVHNQDMSSPVAQPMHHAKPSPGPTARRPQNIADITLPYSKDTFTISMLQSVPSYVERFASLKETLLVQEARLLDPFEKVPLILITMISYRTHIGDVIATCADSSGQIEAIVHEQAFVEFKVKPHFGLTLLVAQASFFAPTRTCRYLVITPRNIVHVFNNIEHVG